MVRVRVRIRFSLMIKVKVRVSDRISKSHVRDEIALNCRRSNICQDQIVLASCSKLALQRAPNEFEHGMTITIRT